jgi:phosphatidylglycerophosphate synthase
VLVLLPLGVPPTAVACAAGATGLAAAGGVAHGGTVSAALLLQLKTVLDNADGQLARMSNRVTVLGRYLDSELDLLVNAALFAGVALSTGRVLLAAAGFVAMTFVLSVNFNVERLYRSARGTPVEAQPRATRRTERALQRIYQLVYAPQDRLVERFVAARVAPDHTTVAVLANLGMSTQLAAFGVCIALGRPLVFAWLALAQLGLVAALALRRELLVRQPAHLEKELL